MADRIDSYSVTYGSFASDLSAEIRREAFIARLKPQPIVIAVGILITGHDLQAFGDIIARNQNDAPHIAGGASAAGAEDIGIEAPAALFEVPVQ